jgi:hypothetical protein
LLALPHTDSEVFHPRALYSVELMGLKPPDEPSLGAAWLLFCSRERDFNTSSGSSDGELKDSDRSLPQNIDGYIIELPVYCE